MTAARYFRNFEYNPIKLSTIELNDINAKDLFKMPVDEMVRAAKEFCKKNTKSTIVKELSSLKRKAPAPKRFCCFCLSRNHRENHCSQLRCRICGETNHKSGCCLNCNKICKYCKRRGHAESICSRKIYDKSFDSSIDELECVACHQKGHVNCVRVDLDNKKFYCAHCSEKGHTVENCKAKYSNFKGLKYPRLEEQYLSDSDMSSKISRSDRKFFHYKNLLYDTASIAESSHRSNSRRKRENSVQRRSEGKRWYRRSSPTRAAYTKANNVTQNVKNKLKENTSFQFDRRVDSSSAAKSKYHHKFKRKR